jgi:membrane-associated protease RseP (regulator of RpoE activity)
MLNEPASSRDERPFVRSAVPEETLEDGLATAMRAMVAEVFAIEEEIFQRGDEDDESVPAAMRAMGNQVTARFVGRLLLDSETAYDRLDTQFATIDHIPLFREENGKHVIIAVEGRINPPPRAWWPNLLLFLATLFSVLLVGTTLAVQEIGVDNPLRAQAILNDLFPNLSLGIPYAVGILLILGAHELGHYFAARRHNLAVTLPYFIPVPPLFLFGIPISSPFGTMGAFIQLRQPMRNRKILFDVGAAGPLAGLIFAVPLLFIGLAGARVDAVTPGGLYEGDSLLYAFAKIVTFGRFLPSGGMDVVINSSQLAWAGWTGLLVSALNLIPIGQLDGGHILYSLIGERARWLYYPLLAIMIGLVFVTDVWLLWVILLVVFGRVYATPLDMITPLDKPRRAVGILAMVIFLLIFVPTPLTPTRAPAREAPSSTIQLEQASVPTLTLNGQ